MILSIHILKFPNFSNIVEAPIPNQDLIDNL
jgi:hypothetical protein